MRWWRQTVAWWSSKLGWNEASWQTRRAAALRRELCSLQEHNWRDHPRVKGAQQCAWCYRMREKDGPKPGSVLADVWAASISKAALEESVIGPPFGRMCYSARPFIPPGFVDLVHEDSPRRKPKPKRKRR